MGDGERTRAIMTLEREDSCGMNTEYYIHTSNTTQHSRVRVLTKISTYSCFGVLCPTVLYLTISLALSCRHKAVWVSTGICMVWMRHIGRFPVRLLALALQRARELYFLRCAYT